MTDEVAILLKRGTASATSKHAGVEGEVIINTTDKSLQIHDNVTDGGHEVLGKNQVDSLIDDVDNIIDDVSSDIADVNIAINTINNTSLPSKVDVDDIGVADGVASLDSNNNIPLSQINSSITGQLTYISLWNADTNTPTLDPAPIPAENGHYYIADVAGTFEGIEFKIGDWIVGENGAWNKLDNTETINSVAGKDGSVSLDKDDVGLDLVDNTSDADKPVSTAQQTVLDIKANLDNPVLTGTPTAPTANTLDNSATIATTEFVKNQTMALVTGVESVSAGESFTVTGPSNAPVISIDEATTSIPGSMSDLDKTKLDGIESDADVNVDTDLGIGGTDAVPTITSTTGIETTLPVSSDSVSGIITSANVDKLDTIAEGAQANVPTNLDVSGSDDDIAITSSTGEEATLPIADGVTAGLVSKITKVELDAIESGAQVNTISTVASKDGDVVLDKDDVGLDLVNNFATANEAEAVEGTSTTLMMTPASVANFMSGVNIRPSVIPEQWLLDLGSMIAGYPLTGSVDIQDLLDTLSALTDDNADATFDVVSYAHGKVGLDGDWAYRGGVYSPKQNRIYFAPYYRAGEAQWQYLDCNTDTIENYTHNASVTVRYIGGVYDPVNDRIYFTSIDTHNVNKCHYIDCSDGSVIEYDTVITEAGFIGGVYSPTQGRIYLIPSSQATYTTWYYINCDTNTLVPFVHDNPSDTGGYMGGVYSPTQNRIYLVPYTAATTQDVWQYIDCNDGSVQNYGAGVVEPAGTYMGGVYSPTQNRIYFIPRGQSSQSTWHYLDCNTGNVETYAHGLDGHIDANAFQGGVYDPVNDRIYFVPEWQSNSTYYVYIQCDIGVVGAYPKVVTDVVHAAFAGGVFSPTQNRIYFVPYGGFKETNWHYIQLNATVNANRQLMAHAMFNKY